MHDLNDLYYFAKVIEHNGFSAASRAIGIPKSRLSRRLTALEEQLGVRLIQRNTRSIKATQLGEAYYLHCKAILEHAEAAQSLVERSLARPKGSIRLSCPQPLIDFLIASKVTEFMTLYPDVNIELTPSGRRTDLIKEGYDLAIRVRFPPFADSDLVIRHLSRSPQRLLASPEFIKQHGRPNTPQALVNLPSLDWERPGKQHCWDLQQANTEKYVINHTPRFVTDDLVALRNAAISGVGLVQLPMLIAHEAIAAGQLIEILPQWQLTDGVIQAAFTSRRGMLPAVRAFIDFLADAFAEEDWLTTPSHASTQQTAQRLRLVQW